MERREVIDHLDYHQKLLLKAICKILVEEKKKTFDRDEAYVEYINLARERGVEPLSYRGYGFKYAFDALYYAGLLGIASKAKDRHKLLVDPAEVMRELESV